MPASESVKKLIETFDNNIDFYKSNQYNEAQLRQEFLDPFFKELGWDMDNEAGLAPQYRDVLHEASIKIGGSTKAPDYAFSIHGQYKFFLEAKKPSINVRDDTEPAYQLRRYGWSAKLPISILTDFEEFAIYDCRKQPRRGDKSSIARLSYFKYTEFVDKWDELFSIFSKEAILKGSFDKYTTDSKHHRGSETVDTAFLEEIENWRNLLARNFALRNPGLSVRDLNFSVQKTIDRIIFLRICEDRGIEDYKKLTSAIGRKGVYSQLLDQFMQADNRYNSGLFHFTSEKGRPSPDTITPTLELDDKVLKGIIENLYYPESPYEFSVLPADILGQVYEQFLGKTISLTGNHRAIIEEKPEIRKAGGVYYTPIHIVEYIVENTLGRLLDGSDPEKLKPIAITKAAKIKVLDPACGSGSFLIIAYQRLLDWHLRQYTADPDTNEPDLGKIKRHSSGKQPKIYQLPNGEWKLSSEERKRILLNNIHGIDIDPQAVEVTKLSLLLKVIEGETHEIRQRDWIRERQRILPDLENNIKCGNSLISPDFYDNEEMLLLDEEIQHNINVFDWSQGFPKIMNNGGFDCIIGNPPYGASFGNEEKEYIKTKYMSYKSRYDSYIYFIEKAIQLLSAKGCAGYITPELWLRLQYAEPLRRFIADNSSISEIVIHGENIFSAAVVSTSSIFISAEQTLTRILIRRVEGDWLLNRSDWMNTDELRLDFRLSPDVRETVTKIQDGSAPLGSLGDVIQGITAYDKYRGQSPDVIKNRAYHHTTKVDEHCVRWLQGKDVSRYRTSWSGEWLSYGKWLAAPREPRFFKENRLLFREVPGTGKRIQASITNEASCYGHSITPFIPHAESPYRLEYFLGLSNSKLMSWYGNLILPNFGKEVFPKLNPKDVKEIPIRPIDFAHPDELAKHDKVVSLVNRILELNQKRTGENNPETLRLLDTQIAITDRLIDQFIYHLYDLTPEEKDLVELSTT
jgi:type I restriction-modification system DNA methylase subunit